MSLSRKKKKQLTKQKVIRSGFSIKRKINYGTPHALKISKQQE
jgi:hypothetical protein